MAGLWGLEAQLEDFPWVRDENPAMVVALNTVAGDADNPHWTDELRREAESGVRDGLDRMLQAPRRLPPGDRRAGSP